MEHEAGRKLNHHSFLNESSFIRKSATHAIVLKRVLKHVSVQVYEMIVEAEFFFFSRIPGRF